MNIPNFQFSELVDDKKFMTNPWQIAFQQLLTELQKSLSNDGFIVPTKATTAEITKLQNYFNAQDNPSVYYGNLLYDGQTNQLKVNIAGTFKVVQVV